MEDYYEAPQEVIARMNGGPTSRGALVPWKIELAVGEIVAVLGFVKPSANNLNYPGIDATRIFKRRVRGGYTNGQLFALRQVERDELRSLVTGLAGKDLNEYCPYDELSVTAEARSRNAGDNHPWPDAGVTLLDAGQ